MSEIASEMRTLTRLILEFFSYELLRHYLTDLDKYSIYCGTVFLAYLGDIIYEGEQSLEV